ALSALGYVETMLELKPTAAEVTLRRALELNPDSPTALFNMGMVTNNLGRAEEALAYMRRAQVAEPLSPNFRVAVAGCLAAVGRFEEALAAFEATLEMQPDFVVALALMGVTHFLMGEFDKTIEVVSKAPPGPGVRALLGCAHARSGRIAEARAELDALLTDEA